MIRTPIKMPKPVEVSLEECSEEVSIVLRFADAPDASTVFDAMAEAMRAGRLTISLREPDAGDDRKASGRAVQ